MKDENKVKFVQVTQMPELLPSVVPWNEWRERLEIHFCEEDINEEKIKKTTLLRSIGSEAYSLVRTLCDPKLPNEKTYKELCDILEQHYMPPVIIFRERQNFYAAVKEVEETVTNWYARVKRLALMCKFKDLDEAIRDKFIIGLSNEEQIFERLCEYDENLTLAEAYKKALIYESKLKGKAMSHEVNFIRGKSKNDARTPTKNNTNNNNGQHKKDGCKHCGWKTHKSSMCKFKDKCCNLCGKKGHLAPICYSKGKKKINFVNTKNYSNFDKMSNGNISNFVATGTHLPGRSARDDHELAVFNISSKASNSFWLTVRINGIQFKAKCDTGSPRSLITKHTFERFFDSKLQKGDFHGYSDYGGHPIKSVGEFLPNIVYGEQERTVSMIVTDTDTDRPILLGEDFLNAFGFKLMQVNSVSSNSYQSMIDKLKSEFSDVFKEGLGKYLLSKVHLEVKPNTMPIFHKPRPVPLAWKPVVEQKLKDLCDTGMLEPVTNSDWGTPIVPVLKPTREIELRICGDFSVTINKSIVDFKYPLPNIEEIFASLQGGQLFTKLDLANAYNQLELDEESQLLCTLSTHVGLFKVLRLPYGVKVAGAIFQKTIEMLLQGIPNCMNFMDDIVITGPNLHSHIETLRKVLAKLKSVGLRLNGDKCKFFAKEITYLGHTIDKNGLRKNDSNIESVLNAPVPSNVSELRAFIGMVNYCSKFIHNFAKKMEPLYQLLRKDTVFKWNTSANNAYLLLKKEVTSDQVLVHFDPKKPIVVTTDACDTAVAGICSHEFPDGSLRPIAFVSRSLTKSERNYSTIQKEALAIVFTVRKLNQYLLGREFILQTDHKPLISIFGENKGIPIMAAARMQRWAFILSAFNFKIKHVKGHLNHADNLSRIPQHQTEPEFEDIDSTYINLVSRGNTLQLSFKDIAIESRRDKILSKVLESVQKGNIHLLKEPEFIPYKNKQNELSVESGCLLWGYRTIIPTRLRNPILIDLHKSHLGIVKTKALARSYIWWPKLDNDIENLVKGCHSCQMVQPSPERCALIPWQPTDTVWSRIHIDFAGPVKNHYFFVIVDSYSKWLEVFKTKSITSHFTIEKLRETFSRYGLIDTIVSDNGTQFTSIDFEHFIKMNHIRHVLTAPGHPATNGQAENSVKTLKKSICACLQDEHPDSFDVILNRFLIDYRNAKHSTTGQAPSEIMFGRLLKTRFSLLKPPLVKEKIIQSQERNIKHNCGKRNKEFKVGRRVYIRDYRNPNKPSWTPAVIKDKKGSRHYNCVITKTGQIIKRHLNQIREAFENNSDRETAALNENEQENQNEQISETRTNNSVTLDANTAQLKEEDEYIEADTTLTQEASTTGYVPSNQEADISIIQNNSSSIRNRPTRSSAREAKEKITAQYDNRLV